jgi:hypothetical protein
MSNGGPGALPRLSFGKSSVAGTSREGARRRRRACASEKAMSGGISFTAVGASALVNFATSRLGVLMNHNSRRDRHRRVFGPSRFGEITPPRRRFRRRRGYFEADDIAGVKS